MMTYLYLGRAEAKINPALKTKCRGEMAEYLILFSLAILTTALCAATPVSAAEARYNHPKVSGYALDYCEKWGKACGRPAADAYCRSKGYRRALRYRVKQNAPPTRVISGGQVCSAPGCDRIDWVACDADGVFKNPTVSKYALDLCQQWGKGCGKPAADAFCRSRGYRESVDFAVHSDNPPTRIIGTGQICNQPSCDRIVLVTCKDRTGGGKGGTGGKSDDFGDAMPVTEDEEAFVLFDE